MSDRFGLLSGKYDSTKQRAVLLQGDRLRNYRRYNASLRMEMLLSGGVLVTDAQFYDGLYFAWMTEDGNELDEFLKGADDFNKANNRCIFKIMQRTLNSQDELAIKMFCKRFLFSSMESKELANFINKIGMDYETKLSDNNMLRKKEDSLKSYLSGMKQCIDNIYGDIYDEEWMRFSQRLEKLFEVAGDSNIKGLWCHKAAKCDDCGKNCIEENREIRKKEHTFDYRSRLSEKFDEDKTYKDKMDDIISNMENIMEKIELSKRHFAAIRSEMIKQYPNRSDIELNFNELINLASDNLSLSNLKLIEENRLTYEKLFNDRYNKELAHQHNAQFIDVCDYNDHINAVVDKLYSDLEIIPIYINSQNVKHLGKMKWKEFYNIISGSDFMSVYNNVIDSYNDDNISEDDFGNILKEYILLLEKRIEDYAKNKVVDINDDSSLAEKSPWNYKNTNKPNLHKKFFSDVKPASFVGGGSYKEGREANEICFFRPYYKNTLYRIRIQNQSETDNLAKDKDFDTVIAPIYNIFNGQKAD